MFAMAIEGKTCCQIARILRNEHRLTPWACVKEKNGSLQGTDYAKIAHHWSERTVKKILENPVYLGDMVSHRYTRKSFKDKRLIEIPESEWIRVPNTHQALVNCEDFNTVQKRISIKKPRISENPNNIFRGLLKCGDCGSSLSYKKPSSPRCFAKYECGGYVRHGKEYCSSHRIKFNDLYNIVLDDIQRNIALVSANKTEYINRLAGISAEKFGDKKSSVKNEQAKIQNRLAEICKILESM